MPGRRLDLAASRSLRRSRSPAAARRRRADHAGGRARSRSPQRSMTRRATRAAADCADGERRAVREPRSSDLPGGDPTTLKELDEASPTCAQLADDDSRARRRLPSDASRVEPTTHHDRDDDARPTTETTTPTRPRRSTTTDDADDRPRSRPRRPPAGDERRRDRGGTAAAERHAEDGGTAMAAMTTAIADRYQLGDRLGFGGMSTVHRATDRVLERTVAVKVLAEHLADDDKFVARFRREALAAAQLSTRTSSRSTTPASTTRPPLHRHGVRRGPVGARSSCRRAGGSGRATRVEIGDPGLRRASTTPTARGHPPRRQAGEPAARPDDGRDDVKLADFGIAQARRAVPASPRSARCSAPPPTSSPEQARGEEAGPGRRRLRARRRRSTSCSPGGCPARIDPRRARDPARERAPAAAELLRPRGPRHALARRPALARGRAAARRYVGPRAGAGARGRARRPRSRAAPGEAPTTALGGRPTTAPPAASSRGPAAPVAPRRRSQRAAPRPRRARRLAPAPARAARERRRRARARGRDPAPDRAARRDHRRASSADRHRRRPGHRLGQLIKDNLDEQIQALKDFLN